MSQTYEVVVEDGKLRPLQPIPLREGDHAEVSLVSDEFAEGETLSDVLRDIREDAAKYPEAWWDDFEKVIQENRVDFVERT